MAASQSFTVHRSSTVTCRLKIVLSSFALRAERNREPKTSTNPQSILKDARQIVRGGNPHLPVFDDDKVHQNTPGDLDILPNGAMRADDCLLDGRPLADPGGRADQRVSRDLRTSVDELIGWRQGRVTRG